MRNAISSPWPSHLIPLFACSLFVAACSSTIPQSSSKRADGSSLVFRSLPRSEPTFVEGFVARMDGDVQATCLGDRHVCTARVSPASTFKVPHALIALDAKVVSGPNHLMSWDGVVRPVKAWNQSHTLATAIAASVVWYFRRLALLIGRSTMVAGLHILNVGNQRIGKALDLFWLDGSLRISPLEQVEFWHRLVSGKHGLSQRAGEQTLSMVVLGRDKDTVFVGKTGWFRMPEVTNVGWLVGCLIDAKNDTKGISRTNHRPRICFASVVYADEPFDHAAFRRRRFELARVGLHELGFTLPLGAP